MAVEVVLKDGSITQDVRLDRLVHFDERSRNYRAVPRGLSLKPRSFTNNFRKYPQWLDQKNEGACVGFGIGHDLLCYPQEMPMNNGLARWLYLEAQKIDSWPGGAYPDASPFYEGTSVLATLQIALKYLAELNPKKPYEYRWCFGGDDVLLTLGRRGVIIGVPWLEGMFNTDANGFIHATGRVAGGHCTYLRGVKVVWRENVTHYEPKDVERELTTLLGRNSWGQSFGINGDFKITLSDLDKLLAMDGEAAVLEPVRRK